MSGGARRSSDPARRREGIAYGLLGLGALALLVPLLVYLLGMLFPPEFDPADPWRALGVISAAASALLPSGFVAAALALVARRLGAGGVSFVVLAFGLIFAVIPLLVLALA